MSFWQMTFSALRPLKKMGLRLAVIMAGVLFCLPAFAQLNLGRINGSVVDQSGGVIAGATVTVVDVDRGVSRPLMTDSAGEYNAPSLTPGTYTIRAEAKGFQTTERQNVVVGVGQELRVDLTLQPGEQTQTVTVTGDIPMVNTTSSELGGNVEKTDLTELPLNGRSFGKLLNYMPGAVSINGNDVFFNGIRQTQDEWMFDGIDDLNDANSGPMVGGTSGFTEATILPVDAIQEVHLATNGSADFGWKPGGAINIGIKSGTNALHGTAFGMGRDQGFEARNPFSAVKFPDRLVQQGATVGGPIIKDKLFFFAAYEGQSYNVTSTSIDTLPAGLASSSGISANNIPDALYGMFTTAGGVAPAQLSLNLVGCSASPSTLRTAALGAANAAAGAAAMQSLCYPGGAGLNNSIFHNPTNAAQFPVSPYSTGGSQNGLAKIDFHLNDKNSFNGEFFIGQGPSLQAGGGEVTEYWVASRYNRVHSVRGVWIWTPNSSWLNEARFGYDSQFKLQVPGDCFESLGQPNYQTQYGFISGVNTPGAVLGANCAFPSLTVSGFAALGGNGGNGGQNSTVSHWAGIDAVSYNRGKHQIKFGFEIHRMSMVGASKTANGSGTLTFGAINAFTGATSATALQDFLAGTVDSSTALVGDPSIHAEEPRYAAFGQDDWRITPKLTMNLGFRVEIVPPITEPSGKIGGFLPTAPEGLVQQGIQVSTLWKTQYDIGNFAPRVGFAYDLTGKGTTVVRAGFGVAGNLNNFNSFISPKQGAAINTTPTGWNLFAANGTLLPSAGNIVAGNLNAPNGSLVNWTPNVQVFNTNTSFLSCGNGLVPTGGTVANPQPCAIQAPADALKQAYITAWNLSIQHAFGANLSLTVAYAGTHGSELMGLQDINLPLTGQKNGSSGLAAQTEQLRRPFTQNCPVSTPGGLGLNPNECFPFLGQILQYSNGGNSNYNGLQVSLQQRVTHGLFFTANYTYSHSLDDASVDYGTFYQNSNCVRCDYGSSTFDFRHNFSIRVGYDIPGKKGFGQMLEGWQVSSAIVALSGQPVAVQDTSSDFSGTGLKLDRWSILGDPKSIKTGYGVPCYGIQGSKFGTTSNCFVVSKGTGTAGSSTLVSLMPAACITAATNEATNPTVVAGGLTGSKDFNGLAALADFGCYFENGTAIVPPAQGTFGNMGRNVLRNGVPYRDVDASVSKNWIIKERLTAQFRAEFFNLLNQTIYSNPGGKPTSPASFGLSTTTNNTGDPILGNGGPRVMVLSLKLIF